MKQSHLATKVVSLSAVVAMFAAVPMSIANAQSVAVTVDGRPAALNPSPLERAGRIFVPLRGVFERLGASVVYENGTINATGNGRAIALHIGSTAASVNGQQQSLDVAPFIVGASTYVPLRFVAQALGASVNWDNANRIVALVSNGSGPVAQQPLPVEVPSKSALRLVSRQPDAGTAVQSNRPTIETIFADGRANPNTLRVMLDDLDITAETSRSSSGIVY